MLGIFFENIRVKDVMILEMMVARKSTINFEKYTAEEFGKAKNLIIFIFNSLII